MDAAWIFKGAISARFDFRVSRQIMNFGPEHIGPDPQSSDDELEEGGSDLEAAANADDEERDAMDDTEVEEEEGGC